VFADNDANSSFNKFWDSFSALYDLHFPLTRVKFNKNKHRINAFMTDELLNARLTKLNLQKTYLKNKTHEDKDRYTAYRNYYNTLLRQSKQKYYTDNLNLK
jgi:hypothetical protein